MFWRWSILLSLLPVLSLADAAPAGATGATCERSSPRHTVALIELYTSEGCSSCPPADRWLSMLPSRFGPDQLVPLSLHVDYWDYIGWRDPFAQRQFTERQRRLASLAGSGTVYTPEVFAGMRELRAWRDGAVLGRRVQEINSKPARADITLAMRAEGGGLLHAEVRFTLPAAMPARAELQGVLVVFEDKRVSEVSRGENRGVTLVHDHVVRHWSEPVALSVEAGTKTLRQQLKLGNDWNRSKLGLAAFVQDLRTGEVLQAVSLPACLPAA